MGARREAWDSDSLLAHLERRGVRRTEPRRRLLAAIAGRTCPFTAVEVYQTLQEGRPTVGRATVFRTIDLLADLGLLQRVGEERGSGSAYVVCPPGHHHHLICARCRAVGDFAEGELETLLQTVATRHAFALHDHRIELYGLCAVCQQQAPAPPHT